MMDIQIDRDHLEDRRRQVARDLAELEEQAAEGEVEAETAKRLHDVYTAELLEIDEALALAPAIEPTSTTPDEAVEASDDGGSAGTDRRAMGFSTKAAVGAAAMLAVITGLIVWAGGGFTLPGSQDEAGPGITIPAGPLDIAAMSTEELEANLEQFPASVDVRLALADRHLADGDTEAAIEHYAAVADGDDATPLQRSRALARIGYLAYATGQLESARQTLMESLELNEDNTEAALYLGYVLLNAFDAPQAAIPYLEQALADPTMPPNIVEDIKQMLADARQATGG